MATEKHEIILNYIELEQALYDAYIMPMPESVRPLRSQVKFNLEVENKPNLVCTSATLSWTRK